MKEHPEDKAREIEARKEAQKFGWDIARTKSRALMLLLLTYGDHDAQMRLETLRTWFWAVELPKAVAKARAQSRTKGKKGKR